MNLDDLIFFCRQNALSFELIYEESDENFQLKVYGAGEGEDFYRKYNRYLEDAIKQVIGDAEKFYAELKNATPRG